jgi:hypothetical protein
MVSACSEKVNYLKVKQKLEAANQRKGWSYLMWKTKTIRGFSVTRCACSVKCSNMVASKIGFGLVFTSISKELASAGGKEELVFALHHIYSHSSFGKPIIKYIGSLT